MKYLPEANRTDGSSKSRANGSLQGPHAPDGLHTNGKSVVPEPHGDQQDSDLQDTDLRDINLQDVVHPDILQALEGLQFGEVTITVREGRVVQIERITRDRQVVPKRPKS